MIKVIARIVVICLLTTLSTVSVRSQSNDKASPPATIEKGKKSPNIPFNGKLNAVDKAAMSVTLEGKEKKRTIHITAQTRIAKAGKPATLDDAIVGEEIAGQVVKNADGREEAVSLRLGPKPETAPKEKQVKKEKGSEK